MLIGVSYATEAPTERQTAGLTYAGVTPEQRRDVARELESLGRRSTLAAVLLLILAAYVYFSG